MSTSAATEPFTRTSPLTMARVAGAFYLLVFVTGGVALALRVGSMAVAVGLVAGALYLVVTVLFYLLFRPVDKILSLAAMLISLAGIAAGPLGLKNVNPLAIFGFYCLSIAYLIFRSTFLPRFLAFLMAFAGVGWLTFLSPPLAKALAPFNFFPGLLGEGALTAWLLVKGVDAERWLEQAGASRQAL